MMDGKLFEANSVRLYMQKKLMDANTKMFDLPQAYVLPYINIPERFEMGGVSKWAAVTATDMREKLRGFCNDHIFVRPCPLDEYYYPNLSFAGVYKSYKPKRDKKLYENLTDGIIKVLQGRYSKYADYYYHRHSIIRNRQISIMFTTQIEDASMYGTAYVYHGKCIYELFDTPLSMHMNDPLRIADNGGGIGLAGKIADCMREAERIAGVPVDIEFSLTRRERVCITEIRPISHAHLEQWDKLNNSTWVTVKNKVLPSNVLNSIGQISGSAIDLRKRKLKEGDVKVAKDAIFLVNHQLGSGVSSLEMLCWLDEKNLTGVRMLVDHGNLRVNDHLQYIMLEDPGISFVAHTLTLPLIPEGVTLHVSSDGFYVNLCTEQRGTLKTY